MVVRRFALGSLIYAPEHYTMIPQFTDVLNDGYLYKLGNHDVLNQFLWNVVASVPTIFRFIWLCNISVCFL